MEKSKKILLFGGTTEGRILAEFLSSHQISVHVCVATEYGEKLLPESKYITVSGKRLPEEEIVCLLQSNDFDMVLDATHPFAVVVTQNVKSACERAQTPYIRVLREENSYKKGVWVENVKEAAEYLKDKLGNILLTTGSNELKEYTAIPDYEERCYPRILTSVPVMEKALELGFLGKNLICMQGPFTKELNEATLKQINATYMVTKESGTAGGYDEKIEAAIQCGVTPIIIGRPKEAEGFNTRKIKEKLADIYGFVRKQKITLLGIGMGHKNSLTIKGIEAIRNCHLVIGAKRVLETLEDFKKETFETVSNEKMVACIKEHSECEHIVVAFSGDVGFFSGAKRLRPFLKGYEVEYVSGISSPIYFLDKIGVSWEDVTFISLHGRDNDIIECVNKNEKVFALLGGNHSVHSVCEDLIANHLLVKVWAGENLSYESERIVEGTPKELLSTEFDTLSVMYIQNEGKKEDTCKSIHDLGIEKTITYGLPDEAFIRGKVPMTKSEVRCISLTKLKLTKDAVVYDVGAGTGSVAIEAALLAKEGFVYAIEKKEDAVSLIEENKKKFHVNNMEVVMGDAPQALVDLPPPTHVFIGGTSGNLKGILLLVLEKNPRVKVVMNVIALESVGEVMSVCKELFITDLDITQVTIAKGKEAGNYHLMTGQNPVYVIAFEN